jgi:hypothetical protein
MNARRCSDLASEAFDRYFALVHGALSSGQLTTSIRDPVPSFPQTLIVTELRNQFALELVGARRSLRALKVVRHRVDDPRLLLGQFEHPPELVAGFTADGERSGMKDLALVTQRARAALSTRFPGVHEQFPTQIQFTRPDAGAAISLGPHANLFQLENVLLVNALGTYVRAKHVRFMLIVQKDLPVPTYQAYLSDLLKIEDNAELLAMQLLPRGDAEIAIQAAQFANVFLTNRLRETIIGDFLDTHREILIQGLGARDFVSEPYLPWQVPSPDRDESAINPDLFVQRLDGFWDVYDLKLPLLERRDVTTGRRRRRRFVQPIEEGIAQLAHYREFLSIPEHAKYAFETYGVEFAEPRYGLIVGNVENVDPKRVADAQRRFERFDLIDYDTLLQMYVLHNRLSRTLVSEGPNW